MRLLSAFLIVICTAMWSLPADARDTRRKSGGKVKSYERGYGQYQRRSSTVGSNGTCQRDTGRPFDSLNLNHQCDREEFWARFNDYGDSRN